MIPVCEIFERFPDGSTLWRASARGIQEALDTLEELSMKTENECYALNLETGEVIPFAKQDNALATHA